MQLLVLSILSVLLLFADYRFQQMAQVRSVLGSMTAPIQIVADVPSKVWRWVDRMSTDYEQLHKENRELKAQAIILQREVQKMASLSAEYIRLRELLNGSELIDETVMVAEVIGVDPDPFTHELLMNKGYRDRVRVGQTLLDAYGVMGQVISTDRFSSRVLLLSDARHAIPVQVNRNGLRSIAAGKGRFDELELLNLHDTEDVVVGDLLVSSGLGGRFPFGYPVAVVTKVKHDPGEPFAEVLARPSAQLTRSRQVMLVLSPQPETQRAADTEETD